MSFEFSVDSDLQAVCVTARDHETVRDLMHATRHAAQLSAANGGPHALLLDSIDLSVDVSFAQVRDVLHVFVAHRKQFSRPIAMVVKPGHHTVCASMMSTIGRVWCLEIRHFANAEVARGWLRARAPRVQGQTLSSRD